MKKKLCEKISKALLKKETLTELIRYFAVAGFCTVFDFAMLYCFTEFAGVNYLVSSVIAFTISALVNYLLCVKWVFSVRNVKKQQNELMYYIILSAVGLGISTTLVWFFTSICGIYYMVSKIVASGITFFCNFALRKIFLHTDRK